MNTERIKEIQEETAYPNSRSVQQALLKVWNECEQEKLVNKTNDIHSVSESFVVSAKFLPFDNKWTGLGVEMGVEGTRKEYNVVYNGDCINEHFDTEQEAKQAALNAR